MGMSVFGCGHFVRNGPVNGDHMDVEDLPNGASKRKSRTSISKPSYKDESDSDAEPLVCLFSSARHRSSSCHLGAY